MVPVVQNAHGNPGMPSIRATLFKRCLTLGQLRHFVNPNLLPAGDGSCRKGRAKCLKRSAIPTSEFAQIWPGRMTSTRSALRASGWRSGLIDDKPRLTGGRPEHAPRACPALRAPDSSYRQPGRPSRLAKAAHGDIACSKTRLPVSWRFSSREAVSGRAIFAGDVTLSGRPGPSGRPP